MKNVFKAGEKTMKNVFQAGDVVYHPIHGKAPVLKADGKFVHVRLNNGTELITVNKYLSFSTWPEPNHIRPEPPVQSRKKGWWLMHVKEDTVPLVRYVSGKSVYFSETQECETGVVSDYVFIRYLGEDWKEETP